MRRILLLVVLVWLPILAWCLEPDSAAWIELSGVLRERMEYRAGYKALLPEGTHSAVMVGHYSNVGVSGGYRGLRVEVRFQDGRAWGAKHAEGNPVLYLANLDMRLGRGFGLTVGRQEIAFNEGWLFARGRFSYAWKAFDALQLRFLGKRLSLRLYGMLNTSDLKENTLTYYDGHPFRYAGILLGEYRLAQDLRARAVVMDDVSQSSLHPARHYHRFTTSLGLKMGGRGLVTGFADGYYQFGQHIRKGQEEPYRLGAWSVNSQLELNVIPTSQGGAILLGFRMVSGGETDFPGGGRWHQFDRICGSTDGIFTRIGMFNAQLGLMRGMGLMDGFGGFQLRWPAFDLKLVGSALAIPSPHAGFGRYLGTGLDLSLSYRLHPMVRLEANYSFLAGTESLERLSVMAAQHPVRGRFAQFAFLSIMASPSYLWRPGPRRE